MFTEFEKDFQFSDIKKNHYYVMEEGRGENSYQSISKCVSANKDTFACFSDIVSIYGTFSDDWSFHKDEMEYFKVKEINPEDYPEYFI